MINELNLKIENYKKDIETKNQVISEAFTLLEKTITQKDKLEKEIRNLQLEVQQVNSEITKLETVRNYLENRKENTE